AAITSGPNRSASSRSTSGSCCSSECTSSSADAVAAPCRANAASASLLPAPIPPVMAIETGLLLVCSGLDDSRLVGRIRDLGTCGSLRLVRGLGRELGCGRRVREDILGQVKVRRPLERRLVLRSAVGVDTLEREREAAALRVDLEDEHGHGVSLAHDLA